MKLESLQVRGYRNFKKATICFMEKTLIIGPNEIGKSNMISALRILLDKGLSEIDLEPKDSDFYAFTETNEIEITAKFVDVKEDCVVSKMKANLHNDGSFFLRYVATRDPDSKRKEYKFFAGKDAASFVEISGRYYIRAFNLRYIDSNRDLERYVRSQKRHLLQATKEGRTPAQITADAAAMEAIGSKLVDVNGAVGGLSFIAGSTQKINAELKSLSFQSEKRSIEFDAGDSDPAAFVDGLQLVSKVGEKKVAIGGDGRNNQIYLAMWASMVEKQSPDPLEVTLFCIEEPEAHLHPHQQRKLAAYLASSLPGQVIITSHSPQIACEFPPNAIVRLHETTTGTLAANDGCSKEIERSIFEFGYRLNVLPAEAFFSTTVLLVEGQSEVLFYKALAEELHIDLDRLNISILSIEGVGFERYINLLDALMIRWAMRTDNDVFKISRKTSYRCAGVQRAIAAFEISGIVDAELTALASNLKDGISSMPSADVPSSLIADLKKLKDALERCGIFLANQSLEKDLVASPILPALKTFFGGELDSEQVIDSMEQYKATFMFDFLKGHRSSLKDLKDHPISAPLRLVESISKSADA